MTERAPSNVIPLERDVETINGVQIDLARLSMLELISLEQQCSQRYEDVHFEWQVVTNWLVRRMEEDNKAAGEAS